MDIKEDWDIEIILSDSEPRIPGDNSELILKIYQHSPEVIKLVRNAYIHKLREYNKQGKTKTQLAKDIGISRQVLWHTLKKLDIEDKDY